MARDEHFVTESNNSADGDGGGGGERSKKSKQNKIPQRGLGVAQLEKLRVEEQRKEALAAMRAADALADNAIGDPIRSPNAIPSPGLHFPYGSAGLNMKRMNEEEWGRWPRLWSDNNRFGFVHQHQFRNVDRQWQPDAPGLPVPGGGPHLGYQFQRPPSSSASNAASSVISPSSVSGSRSEPPSIQTVHNHTSSSPDDDKIVGMKRPYPFSLGSPPPPPPLLPGHFHLRSRSADEFPPFSNEPRTNKYIIRDSPSNSTTLHEHNPSKDVRLTGDFLKLGPPVVASPPLSSDNDSRSSSCQENLESKHQVGLSASKEQHVFSFFPTESQAEQTSRDANGEKVDKIDLNLKL